MRRIQRRAPRQDRARATIGDILEATARIIERDGHDALTTNEIARVAGVGVGSLYQYFATKEAVVAALQEQHFEKMGRPFLARMQELETAPLHELVQGVATLMATSELLNSRLSRQLLAVPQHGRAKAVIDLEQRCAEILHRALMRLSPDADAQALRTRVFLVVQTVEALILSVSQYRPRGLTRQRFTHELAQLVIGYLAPSLAAVN
jgi:AcrR family transcriptional regulator